MKYEFFNFRTKIEMNIIQRFIWILLGERLEHTADGYHVKAYSFRHKTLIVKCEPVKERQDGDD
jgi:hypothetical protein